MSEQKMLEIKGKSIDEAIFNGLQELGVSIDEVSIQTVQSGTKGILGFGAKPFIVRLTVRPADYFDTLEAQPKPAPRPIRANSSALPQKPALSDAHKPDGAPRPAAQKAEHRPVRAKPMQAQASTQRPMQKAAQKTPVKPIAPPTRAGLGADLSKVNSLKPEQLQKPRAAFDQRAPRAPRPAALPKELPRDAAARDLAREGAKPKFEDKPKRCVKKPPRAPRQEAAEPIVDYEYTPYVAGETQCPGADFLCELLNKIGVQATLGFYQQENNIRFRINCDSMGVLIGYRGETLNALQYLTGLVVNRTKQADYIRITLDTQNYRNKREDTLHKLALKMAAQVKATQKPVTLEPMNPYERRVLHATLQSNHFVTTYSEGEEPARRVVILPRTEQGAQAHQTAEPAPHEQEMQNSQPAQSDLPEVVVSQSEEE